MESQQPTLSQPHHRYAYTYSAAHEPIARVTCGEALCVETIDAFEGRLRTESDLFSERCPGPPRSNPQTGPFYVEDAEPGDTLLVHLLDIEPVGGQAVTALIPGYGCLTSSEQTATLNPPLPERTCVLPIDDGRLVWRNRLRLPLAPFIGTLGTAPALEAISSLTPGRWGGNMDCPETTAGATVWLPVYNPGALFFIGDAHARQGDGELTGVAAEMSARVTLRFELLKGRSINWPRIENATHRMAVGSARPLEDAARIAAKELIAWLCEETMSETAMGDEAMDKETTTKHEALTQLDAYELLGLAGELRIGNLVNPNYTVVAKIAKQWLGDPLGDDG